MRVSPAGQAPAPIEDRSMSGAPLAAFAFAGLLFFYWLNRPETAAEKRSRANPVVTRNGRRRYVAPKKRRSRR